MNLLHRHHAKNKTAHEDVAPEERIRTFLQEHKTAVLATVNARGVPHATALYYALDDEYTIRFLTKRGTRKSSNLVQNPQVSLVVFDEGRQISVSIAGQAVRVRGEVETHEAFLRTLRASLHTADSAIPPVSRLDAGDYVAYELRPAEIRMQTYRDAPLVMRREGSGVEGRLVLAARPAL
ncbi:pyridoxamine 5'-phosphate oxidase family protein [Candidatus Saccharibacteria bacterium]|nr:pyridoxamine 5'-phosphate oxidase family protein [Candidatus Saccharibacteria bacterium]